MTGERTTLELAKGYRYDEEYNRKCYFGRLYFENRLIGGTRLWIIEKEEECPEAHYTWYNLEDFFIEPALRGNGAGEFMYNKLIEFTQIEGNAILYHHKPILTSRIMPNETLVGFLLKRGEGRCFKFHDVTPKGVYRFYFTPDGRDIEEEGK